MSAKKAAKKSVTDKTAATKAPAKKSAAKKTPAKKAAAKKAPAKKAVVKKAAVKTAAGKSQKKDQRDSESPVPLPGKIVRILETLSNAAKEHLTPLIKEHGKPAVSAGLRLAASRTKNPLLKSSLKMIGDFLS